MVVWDKAGGRELYVTMCRQKSATNSLLGKILDA